MSFEKSVVSCCLCFKLCSRSLQLNPFSRIFPFFKNMKYLHRQVKAQLSKYQINKFPRASQSSTNIFIIIFRELIIPDVCSSAYGWLQLPFHINDMCRIQDHERAPRPESSSSPPCGSVEQPIGRIWGCNYHVPAWSRRERLHVLKPEDDKSHPMRVSEPRFMRIKLTCMIVHELCRQFRSFKACANRLNDMLIRCTVFMC